MALTAVEQREAVNRDGIVGTRLGHRHESQGGSTESGACRAHADRRSGPQPVRGSNVKLAGCQWENRPDTVTPAWLASAFSVRLSFASPSCGLQQLDIRVIEHAESNERVAEPMRDWEGLCLRSDETARALALLVGTTALL